MKVVAVASGKGGTGKTVIAATLAIRLARQRKGERGEGKIAMIDLNADQASLTQWWVLRGRGVNPYLMQQPGSVIDDVKVLAADGFNWCVIDTPPTDTEIIEFAILVADFVLIPVRLSFLDTNAVDLVVDLCKKRRKPYAILVNAYDRRPQFRKTNTEALAMLRDRGPILETQLPYSAHFITGQSEGKTAPEIDRAPKKQGNIADDVDALLEEIRARMPDAEPALKRGLA